MTRQIAATEPRVGRRGELVLEGICPFCVARLEPRYMENELLEGGPRYGQCDCCGWWWRSDTKHTDLQTLGKDPLCDHVQAFWREVIV